MKPIVLLYIVYLYSIVVTFNILYEDDSLNNKSTTAKIFVMTVVHLFIAGALAYFTRNVRTPATYFLVTLLHYGGVIAALSLDVYWGRQLTSERTTAYTNINVLSIILSILLFIYDMTLDPERIRMVRERTEQQIANLKKKLK